MSKINTEFAKKAESLKNQLKHKQILPKEQVEIVKESNAFQGLSAKVISPIEMPIVLKSGDSIILDFGDHNVGYLNFYLNHLPQRITDTPINLKFTFGEFPFEIITPPESYNGTLGQGWLQNEIKSVVFTPYQGALERRYSFRYL